MAKFFVVLVLILFTFIPICRSSEISLAWDFLDENVLGYRIYWGNHFWQFSHYLDVGKSNSATVINLQDSVQYFFAVTAFDYWGNESSFSNQVSNFPIDSPVYSQFQISESYPNPFVIESTLLMTVPEKLDIKIMIYNEIGQKVNALVERVFEPGIYPVKWDGTDFSGNPLASGVYFYVIKIKDQIIKKETLLLR